MRLARLFGLHGGKAEQRKPLAFRKFSGESTVAPELKIENVGLLCYNILADSLVARRLYSDSEIKHVAIDQRVDKIIEEIDTLKPDLISMQEKQKGEDKSVRMLKDRGYEVNQINIELLQVQDRKQR